MRSRKKQRDPPATGSSSRATTTFSKSGSHERSLSQLARIKRAVVIVVALFACIPLLDAVFSALYVGSTSQELVSYGFGMQQDLDSSSTLGLTNAFPAWFAEEVFAPDDAVELRVSDDEQVVSFVVQGSASECFDSLAQQLASGGWSQFESGIENTAVFMKAKGRCTWIALTCLEVADEVVVSVQCVVAHEE